MDPVQVPSRLRFKSQMQAEGTVHGEASGGPSNPSASPTSMRSGLTGATNGSPAPFLRQRDLVKVWKGNMQSNDSLGI